MSMCVPPYWQLVGCLRFLETEKLYWETVIDQPGCWPLLLTTSSTSSLRRDPPPPPPVQEARRATGSEFFYETQDSRLMNESRPNITGEQKDSVCLHHARTRAHTHTAYSTVMIHSFKHTADLFHFQYCDSETVCKMTECGLTACMCVPTTSAHTWPWTRAEEEEALPPPHFLFLFLLNNRAYRTLCTLQLHVDVHVTLEL